MDKLILIASFAGVMGGVYALCMRATPRKGWLRVTEKICLGIILCYLCHTALRPLGIQIVQSPLAALSAGYWGFPGVLLSSALAVWP